MALLQQKYHGSLKKMHDLNSQALDIIKSKYQLVCTVNLVDYDTRWKDLIKILYKFRNATFEHNQRILILHHDTDYYCEKHSIGNSIYNLFKIFAAFNIPCDKIIFLTNHYGIKKEIVHVAKLIANDVPPTVIYTSLWYDFPYEGTINTAPGIEPDPVTQLFHCLNGKQRMHRIFLLCDLKESGLLDQGIISYHFCS